MFIERGHKKYLNFSRKKQTEHVLGVIYSYYKKIHVLANHRRADIGLEDLAFWILANDQRILLKKI